jgi:integrase/recombinase XerC
MRPESYRAVGKATLSNVRPVIVGGRGSRMHRYNRDVWQAAVDEWVRYLRAAGRAESTIRLRRLHIERALTWINRDPWSVTHDDLAGYMALNVWEPETRKSVRASIQGFYQWGELVGHVEVDPSRKLPSVTVPGGRPKPAPTPVVEKALAEADERVALMVQLAAYAGLRRAEIARLHSDDVIGDSLRIKGKGGKVREVPLHPQLAERLAGRTGFIFPGRDGGHLSPDRVGHLLSAVLGKGWTAHTLRHRFATRAYASERDLLSVQQLLGHSSVATTQRYTQVPDDALRRAIMNVA